MSNLFLPSSYRRPVQLTGKEQVCVLIHKDTGRILCFARDDWFANAVAATGYKKVSIFHAHEYDRWAKQYCDQAKDQSEAEDYAYLERENATRQNLRQQLRNRLAAEPEAAGKQAVESALRCLELMEKRRQRYHETFMYQEGFESTKNAQEVTDKLITGK